MSVRPFHLCVFCASSPQVDQSYKDLAAQLGSMCADEGWRMVYGGGSNGLMGAAADAALARGAEVEGIIPRHLQEKEVGHTGLTKLSVVETMHERQMKMAELGDGFVILPGGLGTLAEFFEIVTWRQLELHTKPVVLVNYREYWSPLLGMIEKSMQEGFLHSAYEEAFYIKNDLDGLAQLFTKTPSGHGIKSDLL